MKTIVVAYWHGKFSELNYEHNSEFDYSVEKRNEIIDDLISKGFSVMLKPGKDRLIIWIDNGRFGQK